MDICYFISPDGEIFPILGRHILMVIKNPGLFKYSSGEINLTYKKHLEQPGCEGKATTEILKKATGNGWIIIKKCPHTCWEIIVPSFTVRAMEFLHKWSLAVLEIINRIKDVDLALPVSIHSARDGTAHECTLLDLSQKPDNINIFKNKRNKADKKIKYSVQDKRL